MIVALIGPSAAGKSSVASRLVAAGEVELVPTYTTRPQRPEEQDSAGDHRFCDDAEFDALLASGAFEAIGGLPGRPYRYGLPILNRRITKPQLVMARASHVGTLRSLGQPTVVYQVEAAAAECRRRLGERGTGSVDHNVRASRHAADIAAGRCCADRVFHNDSTIDDLASAVAAALHTDRKA